MLIVAFPEPYAQGEFEFHYFVAPYVNRTWSDMIIDWEFESEEGDTVFLIFVIVAAIALLCLTCCCFCICKRCLKKNSRIEIIDDDMPLETISPRPANGNDTSVQLDDEHDQSEGVITNTKT
jgi:hypothetical protein